MIRYVYINLKVIFNGKIDYGLFRIVYFRLVYRNYSVEAERVSRWISD